MAETKDTLFVNLYGGPGTGKSTWCAAIFYLEKILGLNAEYVQEYAKDRTWQEDFVTLQFQPYVTGKQLYRMARLRGKVDVANTDSPGVTGLLYQGFGCSPHWENGIVDTVNQFRNVHIYLVRNTEAHPYNPKGRSQDEAKAREIDQHTREILDRHNIPYHVVEIGEPTVDEATQTIHDPTLFAIWKIVKEELGRE